MPVLGQANSIARPEIATEVKIICEQDGYCHQRGRRPVARWVYGEGNFDATYVGPGYYGRPGHRWIWWPFLVSSDQSWLVCQFSCSCFCNVIMPSNRTVVS